MGLVRVTNIQRGCVSDGPGVRTVVFLKGCSLRCPWCCNPETQIFGHQAFVDDEKCLANKGLSSPLCKGCIRTGGVKPVEDCCFGVYETVAQDMTTDVLFEEIYKDKHQYDVTSGGVTFSGGEPLLQADILKPLLERLKSKKVQIAFESTLVVEDGLLTVVNEFVDYWLIDLKLQPEMMLTDKQYKDKMRQRIYSLIGEKLIRLVYVNSMKDRWKEVRDSLLYIGVSYVEILQVHNLGFNKYRKLGLDTHDYSADLEDFNRFSSYLKKEGLEIKTHTI